MSRIKAAARSLLRLPLRLLVNYSALPEEPVSQLGLDPARPIVYALTNDALSDLLTLELCANQLGLPSPFSPLQIGGQSLPRYVCLDHLPCFGGRPMPAQQSLATFRHWLQLHRQDPALDIQLVPITLLWHRAPGREKRRLQPPLHSPTVWRNSWQVLLHGRENRVRFSAPVSLRTLADERGSDEQVAHKLARVARIHFSRQRQAAKGPRLPIRQELFQQLLASDPLRQAMAQQAAEEGLPLEQIQQRALGYLDEIGSDFSYRLIRMGDTLLGWLWHKLYRGIRVHGGEQVRRLAREGHEIVYIPCHRSHMDYLLLSYVIYHQGLIPPHIAAGINLNFWPAGPLFRRGGAFFIRRSFKGDKLYATVFREYLNQLFTKGYAVEFFTEGGRSRTGRLLQPKTGMLAMTLEAQLRGIPRPLTFVPVYLGYDHVMEVNTYLKELKGSRKEKENFWHVLGILGKLRNFGRSYVNFGEPLTLHQYLQQQVPEWRETPEGHKPAWLAPTVNALAQQLMSRINAAAGLNGLPLCALALLASERQALPRNQLTQQIQLYLELLRLAPYSQHCVLPEAGAAELLEQTLELGKFQVEEDKLGQIVTMDRYQAILMTFYRNNILHLFALPALLARLIERQEGQTAEQLTEAVQQLYPLIQAELFLHHTADDLPAQLEANLMAFVRLGLVEDRGGRYWVHAARQPQLLLLAHCIQETLLRYAMSLSLILEAPTTPLPQLESDCQMMAQRLATLHGIHAPEFSDVSLFKTLIATLEAQGYRPDEQWQTEALARLLAQLQDLLPSALRRTLAALEQEA
ncbi:glycerol-3-phosphate 1-O-acyltransferase PlsB [Pseudaeromonas paramecii]|uniref:Glycerol-3-phosphate acyltransferase n=1 Tax=Pseudaeromonas paramecii TaxID=2138166 RepID=A0ABP8QKJ9_9GAMM